MVERPVSLNGVSAGFQVLRYNTTSFEKGITLCFRVRHFSQETFIFWSFA